MDHFWAFVKTVGVVILWFVGVILITLFAAFGLPAIGEFFWENGKLFGSIFLFLLLLGMIVVQYFDFLKAERKKREEKSS